MTAPDAESPLTAGTAASGAVQDPEMPRRRDTIPGSHGGPERPKRRAGRLVASVVATAVAVALAITAVTVIRNPQPIIDQMTVWQFEPSQDVAQHIARLQLTDHGRFLYLASKPEVSEHDHFAEVCASLSDEQDFGILGCYLPQSKLIHLFDVADERLDGTEEITAAHELLHAAWDRMPAPDRDRLTVLLEREAEKRADDTAFMERMDYYARAEPGERSNELHSIVGTEFTELDPELEEYFAQYFRDRTVVTALHTASNAVFRELQERSRTIVDTLNRLREEIEADYSQYTSGYDQLNTDVAAYNARATTGGFTTEQQARGERAQLEQRKDSLDNLYSSITSRSDDFDQLRAELESLNAESAELQKALNIGEQVDVE